MTEVRTLPERLAILETRLDSLVEQQEKLMDKVDSLLALRNRGIGAFWIVSALFGTGIVGIVTTLISYVKGH